MPFDNPNAFPLLTVNPVDSDPVLRLLIDTRDIIARGFCKHNFAEDANGLDIDELDDSAVAFCAAGAFRRAGGDDRHTNPAKEILAAQLPPGFWPDKGANWRIIHYSDFTATQTDMVALFDRAIQARKAG